MLNQMLSDIYRGKNADDIVALQNPINNNSAKIQLSIVIVIQHTYILTLFTSHQLTMFIR